MNGISVVGLGKLGACLAATLAYRGFSVVGVDIRPEAVEAVNKGIPPVIEPHLAEIMSASTIDLRATTDYRDAVMSSHMTFVLVPTPSAEDGAFSSKYVCDAVSSIGAVIHV